MYTYMIQDLRLGTRDRGLGVRDQGRCENSPHLPGWELGSQGSFVHKKLPPPP